MWRTILLAAELLGFGVFILAVGAIAVFTEDAMQRDINLALMLLAIIAAKLVGLGRTVRLLADRRLDAAHARLERTRVRTEAQTEILQRERVLFEDAIREASTRRARTPEVH